MSLQKILKGVSRSFYLSLVLLPKRVRRPIGLAFLACKAADTIADTDLIPKPERLKLLDAYREMFSIPYGTRYPLVKTGGKLPPGTWYQVVKEGGGSKAERALIENLPALMEALSQLPPQDWLLIQELVLELTQGMQIDLKSFPGLFHTEADLEQYIYYVAGCVGRFWTKMMKAHFDFAKRFDASVEDCGEKLGKGLQLVNVLRDLPRDLRQSRCYIPYEMLEKHRLTPGLLMQPNSLQKARPLLLQLTQKAKNYLSEYERYCARFPKYALRLKAVVKLPARLGFKTLELLEDSDDWLDPEVPHKVCRKKVYQILLRSFFA